MSCFVFAYLCNLLIVKIIYDYTLNKLHLDENRKDKERTLQKLLQQLKHWQIFSRMSIFLQGKGFAHTRLIPN